MDRAVMGTRSEDRSKGETVMTNERKLDKKVVVPGLALLAILVIAAEAPLFAQGRATATRSSSGSSSSSGTVSRTSSNSSSSSSQGTSAGRTATPRSSSTSKASNTRQSTPASRGRNRRSGGYGSHHGHNIGLHFGYGGYYGRYYGSYYYPYYYSPFYWGVPYYVPRRAYQEHRLGAFDLNVRPKKAEVYLDGQYIGNAGQYDGFPDHLWLEQGSYELIFYRPGLATERRVLSIYPGVVVDVRLHLAPGESVAPGELSSVDRPAGAMAEVRSAYENQARQAPSAAPPASPAPRASAEMDTRAAPGRVRLNVVPADASVYLDGRLLGSGEELARLHAGLVVDAGGHMLEVVRPGYATERREFAVGEGDEVELEVLLEAG
jgi:hypothetical protein